ncbi:hypothetical protein [Vibrio lentus]|uniref:hypothetical protein n=1 Tax=Vibrio lentus TaxID=136468 RepID=UPI000CB47F90|nr:hypothetical protein [Vibrio lentus]PMH00360.1 hypothetical protein BCU78_15920 [Vibrio lentus]
MSELHKKAEALVLCAIADDTCNNCEASQEVGPFLLRLIREDKKRQCKTAYLRRWKAKIMRVVASNDRGVLETKR